MELGRLEEESTASLCRRLAGESRTGCLHLVGEVAEESLEAHIYLREGRIYTATAPGGRARLGDRLIGGGDLSPEQLDMALVLKQEQPPSTRLGDVLVTSGLVDRETLRRVIRDQIVDSVAVPLAWTSGSWRFAEGEAVAEDIPLGLGVQDTLMEAARRLEQIEVIHAHMGSMDTVVDFARTGDEAKLSLTPDEWAMLTHIDGFASVADIAERTGYTELGAARIIYGLLAAGVVVRADEDSPPLVDTDPTAEGDPDASALPTRRGHVAEEPDAPDGASDPDTDTDTDAAGAHLERLEGLGLAGTSPLAPVAPPAGSTRRPPPARESHPDVDGRDGADAAAPRSGRLRDRFRRGAERRGTR